MSNFVDWFVSLHGFYPSDEISLDLLNQWVMDCGVKARKKKKKKAKVTLSIRIDEEDKNNLKQSAIDMNITLSRLCSKLLSKETLLLLDKEVGCGKK